MDALSNYKNKIICGKAQDVLKQLPSASIDLVLTSPPYNIKNSSGNGFKKCNGGRWKNAALIKGYDTYDDNLPHSDYVNWQRECLAEMMRVLKDDGAIFYVHKWRVQNGLLQDRSDILAGFPVRQIIIWRRKGGINFNTSYYLPTFEVIYLLAKPRFKLLNEAIGYGDVWELGQEMSNPHPAPFPIELAERVISSTSAQIILDPFIGSGTTAVAAQNKNRDYIGIEVSPKYCEMAEERILSEGRSLLNAFI